MKNQGEYEGKTGRIYAGIDGIVHCQDGLLRPAFHRCPGAGLVLHPNWAWYASEFDGGDIFLSCDGIELELGYYSLQELKEVAGLLVGRGIYFEPYKSA